MRRISNFVNEALSADGKVAYMVGNKPLKLTAVPALLEHKAHELQQTMTFNASVQLFVVSQDIVIECYDITEFDSNGAPDIMNSVLLQVKPRTISKGTYSVLIAESVDDAAQASAIMLVNGQWVAIGPDYVQSLLENAKIETTGAYFAADGLPKKRLPGKGRVLSIDQAATVLKRYAKTLNDNAIAGYAQFVANCIVTAKRSMTDKLSAQYMPDLNEFDINMHPEDISFDKMKIVPYVHSKDDKRNFVIIYYKACWWLIDTPGLFLSCTVDRVAIDKDKATIAKATDKSISEMVDSMIQFADTVAPASAYAEIGQCITKYSIVPAIMLQSLDDSIGGKEEMLVIHDDLTIAYVCINDGQVIIYYDDKLYRISNHEFVEYVCSGKSVLSKQLPQNEYINESKDDITFLTNDAQKVAAMMQKEGVEYSGRALKSDVANRLAGYKTFVENEGNGTTFFWNNKTNILLARNGDITTIEFKYNQPVKTAQELKTALGTLNSDSSNEWEAHEFVQKL